MITTSRDNCRKKADRNTDRPKRQKMVDCFRISLNSSLHLKMTNFSNPRPFFYFPEKFSPPQTGEFFESQKEEHFHFSKNSPGETETLFCLKKSLNIAKMVEKRFELPTSTHDLSYEKIRLADCHKIPIFF